MSNRIGSKSKPEDFLINRVPEADEKSQPSTRDWFSPAKFDRKIYHRVEEEARRILKQAQNDVSGQNDVSAQNDEQARLNAAAEATEQARIAAEAAQLEEERKRKLEEDEKNRRRIQQIQTAKIAAEAAEKARIAAEKAEQARIAAEAKAEKDRLEEERNRKLEEDKRRRIQQIQTAKIAAEEAAEKARIAAAETKKWKDSLWGQFKDYMDSYLPRTPPEHYAELLITKEHFGDEIKTFYASFDQKTLSSASAAWGEFKTAYFRSMLDGNMEKNNPVGGTYGLVVKERDRLTGEVAELKSKIEANRKLEGTCDDLRRRIEEVTSQIRTMNYDWR